VVTLNVQILYRGRTYSSHIVPLVGAGGAINGTVGVALDITDRKRAEKALARREAQLVEAQRLTHVGNGRSRWPTDG